MFSRGGSRDALVHSLPMEPSVKKFQHSVRREPPNRFLMIEYTDCTVLRSLGSGFQCRPVPEIIGFPKFGSARLAAGRRPPSVRLSKCFCGRLQIVPKAPPVKKSEHSARRGPPNSRGTVVHGFPFFESRFRELVFFRVSLKSLVSRILMIEYTD